MEQAALSSNKERTPSCHHYGEEGERGDLRLSQECPSGLSFVCADMLLLQGSLMVCWNTSGPDLSLQRCGCGSHTPILQLAAGREGRLPNSLLGYGSGPSQNYSLLGSDFEIFMATERKAVKQKRTLD